MLQNPRAGFNIANGDNIFALLGTRASPTTFLAFVGDIDGPDAMNPSTLNGTGLTDGTHAVNILSNAIYTGSTTCNGTLTDCLQMINDNSNWNAGAFPSGVPTSFDGSNFVTCDDSTSPTITCPGPQNRDLDGSCSYTIEDFTSLGTAMDLDNCGAVAVTQSPAANGSITTPGTTQVTLTATDGDNNTGNCNFNLIVADNSAPTVTCPVIDFSAQVTVQVVRNDFGDPAGVSWQILDAGNNVVANQTTTLPVGPTAINYNLPCDAGYTLVLNSSIGAGLLDAQVQVAFIPIIDLDPPIASGSYPFTIAPCNAANPGTCSVVLSGLAPTVNDNCAATTTYTLMGATTGSGNTDASGSTFNVGTTTLMYTATDAAGNAGSCSVDITIDDNTNPTANCPTNITQNQTAGQCGANVNFTIPAATDNCSVMSTSANPASGSFFAAGTTQVTVTAMDASGNTGTCTFDVTINDTENPTANCPGTQTVANTAGQCGANVSFSIPTPTDNCTATSSASPASGSFFNVGTTQVTVTATDGTNTDQCTFNVVVNDTENPTAICPGTQTVNSTAGQCGANVSFSVTNPTDNCPGATSVASPVSGSFFNVGTTQVTVTATDGTNTDQCTFNVVVNDTENPTINCPNNITVNAPANQCFAAVLYASPSTSDNCPGETFVCNPVAGSNFNVGTTTVTCTVTDVAGNSANCSFNITVNDVTPPSATCPNDINVNAPQGACGANVAYAGPLVNDACGIAPEGGVICSPNSGSFFGVGSNPVTCTVMDANGNTTTCSFNININDNEDPVAMCPATQTRNNAPGQCGAIVTFAVDQVLITALVYPLTLSHPSGSFFPVGTTTVM
jgi:hypothetical protein